MSNATRDLALRVRNAFARTDVPPATLVAAWPAMARALHSQAQALDTETGVRFSRLAPSAWVIETWNAQQFDGPATPDPIAVATARQVAEADLSGEPAAELLDGLAWTTSGQVVSRLRDAAVDVQWSKQGDHIYEGLRDLRRVTDVMAAANVLTEVDVAAA